MVAKQHRKIVVVSKGRKKITKTKGGVKYDLQIESLLSGRYIKKTYFRKMSFIRYIALLGLML